MLKKERVNTPQTLGEIYKQNLSNINTITEALRYTDSIYLTNKFKIFDTAVYVQIVSSFIKERFYHGLSSYSFDENWIAYLSSKLIWSDFSALVDPDDIMKHPAGLCSQQTIVFMELIKRKGMKFRSVGLGYKEGPGHFLCEIYYNNSWRLYDVTKEPQWDKIVHHHLSMNYYLDHKDSLFLVYESKLDREIFNKLTEKVVYGKVNTFPAQNMYMFQLGTLWLTYLLPAFILGLYFYLKKVAYINKDES